jgi:hypothetical protein
LQCADTSRRECNSGEIAQLELDLPAEQSVPETLRIGEGERLMLDGSKYAQHFPDESHLAEIPGVKPASDCTLVAPPASLLAALVRLEREFEEILRTQQAEPTSRSE